MATQFTFNVNVNDLFSEINTEMNWVSPATSNQLAKEFHDKFGYELYLEKVSPTKWLDNKWLENKGNK